jgi:hypothetical protein
VGRVVARAARTTRSVVRDRAGVPDGRVAGAMARALAAQLW